MNMIGGGSTKHENVRCTTDAAGIGGVDGELQFT